MPHAIGVQLRQVQLPMEGGRILVLLPPEGTEPSSRHVQAGERKKMKICSRETFCTFAFCCSVESLPGASPCSGTQQWTSRPGQSTVPMSGTISIDRSIQYLEQSIVIALALPEATLVSAAAHVCFYLLICVFTYLSGTALLLFMC